MEVERTLSSIQWKITRSFIVATSMGALLFTALLFAIGFFVLAAWQDAPWIKEVLGLHLNSDRLIALTLIIGAIAFVGALFGGIVIGFYNGRKLKRSLQSLSWAAEKLKGGALDYRIQTKGEDEIAELAVQFNQMADRLEAQVGFLQRLVRENAELHQHARQHAIDEERQRLARDLHDSISQQLFAIMMTMASCARIIDKDVEKAKKQFAIIENIATQAQAEMRTLLLHLRPLQLEGRSIGEALTELLQELKSKHAIDYVWDIGATDAIPIGIDEHLFRIAQEALSNALRHSGADRILLTLHQDETTITLRISDNGNGFDREGERSASSMGLLNIAERTESIGGVWELITALGKGTTVEVRVPIIREGDEQNGENSLDHRR